jgi:hypothetical protein
MIDEEARLIVSDAYQRTMDLLNEKRAELNILAEKLLAKEVLPPYRHSNTVLEYYPPTDIPRHQGPDDVFQETSARYRAVEPSTGSNVIPRRARPGIAGLRPQ